MSVSALDEIRIGACPRFSRVYDPVKDMTPFDALKHFMEQVIFSRYLQRMWRGDSTRHTKMSDYLSSIAAQAAGLPPSTHSGNEVLDDLYSRGLKALKFICENSYIPTGEEDMRIQDYIALFSTPPQKQYPDYMLPTINEDILIQAFFHDTSGAYDKGMFPDGKKYGGALYVPSEGLQKRYLPFVDNANDVELCPVITLHPIDITYFDMTKYVSGPYSWILNYNLGDHTLDDLVGIFANFAISREKYFMTDVEAFSLYDICFDLVTGSSETTGAGTRGGYSEFITGIVRTMVERGYLKPSQDAELFGSLLAKVGAPSDLVNYFLKPVSEITAMEAMSFRRSELAAFMADRLVAGLAAADEGDQTGDDADAVPLDELEGDTAQTDPTGDGTTEGDDLSAGDPAPEDKPGDEEEKEKPHIDPGRMLLELSKPNETMADYIFRETVAKRIEDILKNPPANAMPNDLLMLKRWRSRWLYLVNIPCLRDFLTRISIRLSDV